MTTPLNLQLYQKLAHRFGDVKITKAGQQLRAVPGSYRGQPSSRVTEYGETYKVCCPSCSDTKFHLYISHGFDTPDETGRPRLLARCFRCQKVGGREVAKMLEWTSIGQQSHSASLDDHGDTEPFISPGTCVRVDTKDDPRLEQARTYLAGRGIDPDEAGPVYGVCVCVEANTETDAFEGAMVGRIILPTIYHGQWVGWQGRLAFNPHPFEEDQDFGHLRWISMPGAGWRFKHVFGYDAAVHSQFCVLVEGPTDTITQGPPCIGTMGQTVSQAQIELIAGTWGDRKAILVVGDAGQNEDEVSAKTAERLRAACKCPVYNPRLPHGDPGSWKRADFVAFLVKHMRSNLQGIGMTSGKL